MVPLYNGFYPFPLARAVNSNSLIFDPSEFKIDLYHNLPLSMKNSILLLSCIFESTVNIHMHI